MKQAPEGVTIMVIPSEACLFYPCADGRDIFSLFIAAQIIEVLGQKDGYKNLPEKLSAMGTPSGNFRRHILDAV